MDKKQAKAFVSKFFTFNSKNEKQQKFKPSSK